MDSYSDSDDDDLAIVQWWWIKIKRLKMSLNAAGEGEGWVVPADEQAVASMYEGLKFCREEFSPVSGEGILFSASCSGIKEARSCRSFGERDMGA